VLACEDVEARSEAVIQLVLVAEALARLRSHHALMLVVSCMQSQAIFRLKKTWALVEQCIPGRWAAICDLVGTAGTKLVLGLLEHCSKTGVALGYDLRNLLRPRVPVLSPSPVPSVGPNPGPGQAEVQVEVKGRGQVDGHSLLLAKITADALLLRKDETSDLYYLLGPPPKASSSAAGACGSSFSESQTSGAKSLLLYEGLPQKCPDDIACMPYVNGFIQRLLRLNEMADYIREDGEFVCAASPGQGRDDPFLPLANMSKSRAMAALIATVRSCQMNAYMSITPDPYVLQLLLRRPQYETDDSRWARSKVLEPTVST
jgi:hypothetical protein